MDFSILYAINGMHNAALDKIMVAITSLGNLGAIWVILAVAFLFRKNTRKCGIMILISLIVCFFIGNLFLKNFIARQRPCWIDKDIQLLIDRPKDYSFPSGHTLAAFGSAVMIYLHNKRYGTIALGVATLIGFSRMYLFVHFPTDILGGALLGAIISMTIYDVYDIMSEKIREKKEELESE